MTDMSAYDHICAPPCCRPILENVGVAPDEEVLQVPQVVRQSGPNPEGDRQLNVAIAKAVEALQKSGRV